MVYTTRVLKLLVLGGSSFVGRAVVEDALVRGWEVTTFNRGETGDARPDVTRVLGDRLEPRDVAKLAGSRWDLAVDTWAGAPRAARDSAAVLADRVGHYVYVSSTSVYAPPPPVDGDESAATVDASPDAESGEYAQRKRGAEIAIKDRFGDRALFARSGLILGPWEDVGRLPWWLLRLERGGDVLAPGPPERPLQFIDVRDLARWLLDSGRDHRSGAFNVVARPGHATTQSLLEACRAVTGGDASLVWVDPDAIEAAGIEPWTELPIWLPPDHEYRGLHAVGVDRAHAAGLRCRPSGETVRDTWQWLVSIDRRPPLRTDLSPLGVTPDRERAVVGPLVR